MNILDSAFITLQTKAMALAGAGDWEQSGNYGTAKNATGSSNGVEKLMGYAGDKIFNWAGIIITIIGAFMIFLAIWKLFKKFGFEGSPEQGQPPKWSTIIALFVIGGACMVGGISMFTILARSIGTTVQNQIVNKT